MDDGTPGEGGEGGEAGTDNDPPPDGLTDPNDDGSGDTSTDDEEQEINVQHTILQISQLDRTLAKRKNFNDFQDYRSTLTAFKNIVNNNEATIPPAVREAAIDKIDTLYNQVTDYLTYKFGYYQL